MLANKKVCLLFEGRGDGLRSQTAKTEEVAWINVISGRKH